MRSWKTTLAGVCTILTALSAAGTALANGEAVNVPATITAVMLGIGLIMAKDATVGGGGTVKP